LFRAACGGNDVFSNHILRASGAQDVICKRIFVKNEQFFMDTFLEANRQAWDQITQINVKSAFYDLEGFKNGKSSLNPIELEGVGPVAGKNLLHLQCHFGMDTLSWARLGARATGIDFSPEAISNAKQIAEEMGIPARFICSDVYQLPEVLNEQFDIVFTSYGALCWLPDLDAWAALVRRYLRPGGIFFVAEFHPALYLFDFNTRQIAYHYFNQGTPFVDEDEGSYADRGSGLKTITYFWPHSLAEIMGSLLRQGLQLLDFREYDYSPYNCFPNMEERAPGEFVFGGFEVSFPHVFCLKFGG